MATRPRGHGRVKRLALYGMLGHSTVANHLWNQPSQLAVVPCADPRRSAYGTSQVRVRDARHGMSRGTIEGRGRRAFLGNLIPFLRLIVPGRNQKMHFMGIVGIWIAMNATVVFALLTRDPAPKPQKRPSAGPPGVAV